MIIDTGRENALGSLPNGVWKYKGLARDSKLGIVAFWTNSKHQFYKMKNSKCSYLKFISLW